MISKRFMRVVALKRAGEYVSVDLEDVPRGDSDVINFGPVVFCVHKYVANWRLGSEVTISIEGS